MSKLRNMRAIEIPKFRAVSSGLMAFEELFGEDGFSNWIDVQNAHLILKQITDEPGFMWPEDGKGVLIRPIKDEVTEEDTAPYEIIEFPGGMFLVATCDETDRADLEEAVGCMREWIKNSDVFEYGDFPQSGMCNMPNADGAIDKALGIAQQQIFLPLKFRAK